MPKILMINESSRVAKFARMHVTYKCGCSVYNDSWESVSDANTKCKVHGKEIKATCIESVIGHRPEISELKQSFFKVFTN